MPVQGMHVAQPGRPDGEVLKEWSRRQLVNVDGHNWAERWYRRWYVGCVLVSVGALVALGSAAASFDLSSGRSRYWAVGLTVASALASVLVAVCDFGGLAASHKAAARAYARTCRDMDLAARHPDGSDELVAEMRAIVQEWDWAASVAPNVPVHIRRRAQQVDRDHQLSTPR